MNTSAEKQTKAHHLQQLPSMGNDYKQTNGQPARVKMSPVVRVATRAGKWQKMCQEVKGTLIGKQAPSTRSPADEVWKAVGDPPSEAHILDISFVAPWLVSSPTARPVLEV